MSTFKKPIAGEPANLILGESFQSALVNVVNAYQRGELTKKPTEVRKDHVVMVNNVSGSDVKSGEMLSLNDSIQPPTYDDTVQSFMQNPLTEGDAVTWHGNIGQIAIAVQPILNGMIGPCAYRPWGQVQADIGGTGDWLMISPDDPKQFKRATGGIARVINPDFTTGKCVADFLQQQPLWRFELTEDVSNLIGIGNLIDLGGNVYAANTSIRFTNSTKVAGDAGFCVHTGNYFDAIEAAATTGGEPTPRFRFRLKTDFDDTGVATAYVLDVFGSVTNPDGSPVELGDILTVHDPRKCFAHAVGADSLATIQAESDPFFPDGGSIGYAVKTLQLKANPNDPDDEQYPRWEVEQCTQTVQRMKVKIDSLSDATGGNTTQPTGELGESAKTLFFYAEDAILSRWPDVDYAPEWIPSTETDWNWEIQCENPHRFSAQDGWAIIERVVAKSRVEDATNVDTPYSANVQDAVEWHIIDVENPIARWLQVQWSGGSWRVADAFAEGENPGANYRFNDAEPVSTHIRDAPGLTTGCLDDGELGWAFWDPNEQYYNVVATDSALLGAPVGIAPIIGVDFNGCDLNYTKLQGVKVFGGKEDCEFVNVPGTTSPDLVPVPVVTGITIDPEHPTEVCFSTGTVYVCSGSSDPVPTCIDVCDPCYPPETGCCEYPPGTYTDGITFDVCQAQGGDWTPGECPTDPDCPICDLCDTPGGGVYINLQQFEFAAGGTVAQGGVFTVQTTVQSGSCTATATGFFTPLGGGAQTPASCEMTLVADALSPSGYAIECVWSPSQIYGCTLDASLFGSFAGIDPCADTYGLASGGVDPPNPPEGNFWTDYQVDTNPCIP